MRRKKFYVVPLALLLVLALAVTLAGCGKAKEQQQQPPAQQQQQQTSQEQQQPQTTPPSSGSTGTSTEQQATPAPSGQAGQEQQAGGGASLASGKDYVKANCLSCHQVEGEGSGKDLSKVGSKYDAAALKDYLKTKPPMPFKGSDAELEAVAQYLASLK